MVKVPPPFTCVNYYKVAYGGPELPKSNNGIMEINDSVDATDVENFLLFLK